MSDEISDTDIAIIGMAGRFPGARDAEELFSNLVNGVESVRDLTDRELADAGVTADLIRNPLYVKRGAPLEDMEMFDAGFFGFSPKDAAIMDPQHRHFLECAWEAMERAGHVPEKFVGQVGVFGGSGMTSYMMWNLVTNPQLMRTTGLFLVRHTGNDKDFLTTRVSYELDLKGPSVNVQTACSTSLVAIHYASQSLLSGECDMALAGGVTIELPHRQGYLYHEGEILSPDGRCRAFDHRSAGTVFGSGVGIVVLRRLRDAIDAGDHIHAVIKGSAINNDGAMKAGYLAPSVDGQAASVAEALALSGVPAETITYIETHGTGTPVGDPIEIAALTQAFRAQTQKKQFCAIGSIKPNIGHLDTAAGIAGFIKAVSAIEHAVKPPSLHFEAPNPLCELEQSPFFVNATRTEWTTPRGVPRRAGVSSLGVGGTNAHIILEEAPPRAESAPSKRPYHLLMLSAKTERSLDAATSRLAFHLARHPEQDLADVAYTLRAGRRAFDLRRVVAVRDREDAMRALEPIDRRRVQSGTKGEPPPSIVFTFPGGGAQSPNMGRELYDTEPVYRAAVDDLLPRAQKHLDADLRSVMFPPEGQESMAEATLEKRTSLQFPAIVITSLALARLWESKGVKPDAMTGHSLGEYVAAHLSGVMNADDLLFMVILRGQLFERMPRGAMLSVPLSEKALAPYLEGEEIDLAVINAAEVCVASGTIEGIEKLEKRLAEKDIETTRVRIATAAHSRMLDPILEEFRAGLQRLKLRAPDRLYVSNVTGTWVRPEDAASPDYWTRHLRSPVRFAQGLGALLEVPGRVLLEVGPGQALTSLSRSQPQKPIAAIASLRHPRDVITDGQAFLTALGRLWTVGAQVSLDSLDAGEARRRVPLPAYAFDRQRYWMEPGKIAYDAAQSGRALQKLPNVADWFYKRSWARTAQPRVPGAARERWLVFLDREVALGEPLVSELRRLGHDVVKVTSGPSFLRTADDGYAVNPRERADYRALLDDLVSHDRLPTRVVHLWSITGGAPLPDLGDTLARGFFSLLFFGQAIAEADLEGTMRIGVVTDGTFQVAAEALFAPEKATLLGPVRVLPKEMPNLSLVCIGAETPQKRWIPSPRDAKAIKLLAKNVIAEVGSDATDSVVVYRGEDRFTELVERTKIEAHQPLLREGGVYLVTGGLGGIGLELAEYLARRHRAKLVLVSRRALPPENEWSAWVDGHGDDNATSTKIMKLLAMREHGAETLNVAAHVARHEDMARVVRMARDRFGKINGVFHAAGVIDDGLAQLKDPETATRVLAPKVEGARVLDDLLGDSGLDFFVMFSSTSAILGPAGQVDYVAANAFLDAFAQAKTATRKLPYIAVDWGVWSDVGMAVSIALGKTSDGFDQPPLRPERHPLLETVVEESPSKTVFAARYGTASHWMLDEHRLKGGRALVPGTGYIEIARAAHHAVAGSRTVEIRDLHFIAPLEVENDIARDVRVTVSNEGKSYAFSVESRVPGETEFAEHARGLIGNVVADPSARLDLKAIERRCTKHRVEFDVGTQETQQEAHLDFGKRWKNLRWMAFGDREAIAMLELQPQFTADLDMYALHPALLDLATGFPLPLAPGYDSAHLYVPLGYDRIRVRAPLTSRMYSHARFAKGDSDVLSFDYVITNASGEPLVEIRHFTMKRIVDPTSLGQGAKKRAPLPTRAQPADALLSLAITEGITPAEGMDALERILGGDARSQIVVSSLDFALLAEKSSAKPSEAGEEGGASKFERPELSTKYEAPRDELERTLASFWQELLGVERVGIRDDFFEIGGQSLLAVRLFNRIKKTYQVELPLSTLFEAPTIAQCADVIREERGMPAGPASEVAARDASAPVTSNVGPSEEERPRPSGKSRWSSLVPMQPRGDEPPIFCIGGMGGNTLNLRRLAMLLGESQPFYGLQPPGLDGKQPRITRVEDLAAHYVREMQEVQQEGPFRIGGYSGGGVAAFEMARQLGERGQSVELLFFLDSFCPVLPKRTYVERMRIHVERAQSQGPAYLYDAFGRRFAYEQREAMRRVVYRPLGALFPYKFRHENIEDSWVEAEDRYVPTPYEGSAVLFRARVATSINAWTAFDIDETYGWAPFVQGGVEVFEVPGDHSSMCEEPHVRALAASMREVLAKLERPRARAHPEGPRA